MTDTSIQPSDLLETEDGVSLKVKLARATRRNKLRALSLVAPLGIFLLIGFLWPIGAMLLRSVHAPDFGEIMYRTAAVIENWDGEGIPDETIFAAVVEDLRQAKEEKTIGRAATRFNFSLPGTRSVFTRTGRKINTLTEGPYTEALIEINDAWGDHEFWLNFQRLVKPFTTRFYLNSVDYQVGDNNEIVSQPEERQIYVRLFIRTLIMSAIITAFCIFLGYPVSYLLATLPLRYSNLLMILVLLPFWTSLLVRTTSWITLLQKEGVLNDIVVALGLVSDENRLQMMFNATGTTIAMVHILLPFMILPLFSVMKTIPPSYMRAARSMGANQFTAFRRVYIPQTLPGVGAGSILVFILSIGFYITPALVGGQSGQLISNIIAYHMQRSLNWGLAAALATILLIGVLFLYWLYNKIVGVDNMKFG
jgi:putative spermidine/putrescine transport system permease protein